LSAIVIFDIPIIGLSARGHLLASLDRAFAVAVVPVVASDVGANRRAGHGAASRRNVSSATATHLVADHATDNGADDGPGHVNVSAAFFAYLLAINPTTRLWSGAKDGPN
jgi:hypothetical protein